MSVRLQWQVRTAKKIWNKYSQKRICAATVPISTFMCLWTTYIFPPSICLFCCRKYVDRSWKYINCSWTHGTETAQFPEKEYINGIFVAVRMKITTHSSPYALYNVNIFVPFICGATVRFYEVLKILELYSFISLITIKKFRRDTVNI